MGVLVGSGVDFIDSKRFQEIKYKSFGGDQTFRKMFLDPLFGFIPHPFVNQGQSDGFVGDFPVDGFSQVDVTHLVVRIRRS